MHAEPYVALIEAPCLQSGEVEREHLVSLDRPEVHATTQGEQGPPGRQGAPGPAGGAAVERLAGETLSALRAVYELDGHVFALDYRDSEHIDLLLGVTLTAADPGQPINVQRLGAVDDDGWNWQPGRVWLGSAGSLTQTPPADGYDVLLGAAVASGRLLLNLQDPIELE
uniref:Uncharacterized protein n=1 Tax=Ectopseudomonas mendocina (strain ymp) TaxID=399739 RepID=A4XZD6_ECTM1